MVVAAGSGCRGFAGIVGTGLAIAATRDAYAYDDGPYYGGVPVIYYVSGPAYYGGGPAYYGPGPNYQYQRYGGTARRSSVAKATCRTLLACCQSRSLTTKGRRACRGGLFFAFIVRR